jgi:hypothetical protein
VARYTGSSARTLKKLSEPDASLVFGIYFGIEISNWRDWIRKIGTKSTFKKEIQAVCSKHSKIDNYLLITDLPLTSDNRDVLQTTALSARFSGNFGIVDGNEVCEWLDLHPQLRRLFPQLLGLSASAK